MDSSASAPSSPEAGPAERQVSTFLSLAPATSHSYPQPRRPQPAENTEKRRSSSSSSASKVVVLKLNPVHSGQHLDGHDADWHEVAIV